MKVAALGGRGAPRDVIDAAACAEHFTFQEMERLAWKRRSEFRLERLVQRLEYVPFLDDDAFAQYGLSLREIDRVRAFAGKWADDINMRLLTGEEPEPTDPARGLEHYAD